MFIFYAQHYYKEKVLHAVAWYKDLTSYLCLKTLSERLYNICVCIVNLYLKTCF